MGGEKIVEVHDRVPQERTYFAWHTPAFSIPATPSLISPPDSDGGLSARLNKTLVYDKQVASDVTSFQCHGS